MRAVVFDFDGVLVRSMELHAEAYRQTLKPLGVAVADEQIFQLEGGRSESVIAHLLKAGGVAAESADVPGLSQKKQEIYTRLGPPTLYPGADRMVREVRERAQKIAIVTGTRRENLARLIPALLPLFDAVLAQDAYKRDKPDPEPYANTAAALGLAPAACVAIENAPNGVTSARAAGYGHVVGITTTVTADQLRRNGAHVVVGDHGAAARALIAALGR